MEVITIETEAYNQLIRKIDELILHLKSKDTPNPHTLLTNSDVRKLLGISEKTLFNYRSQGLAYFKVGKKIFYKRSDIEAFLKANYQEAF